MEQNLQQQDALKVQELVDGAFGKGLASTIMAWFPITSIIAIFLAAASKKASKEALRLATALGIEAGGKNIAAKILNTVGLISGIVMTCFWGLYILIFAIAMIGIMFA